ncbi:MAG: serpin family protein, partial [Petrimonas sp.]|nr:serpin family protein [Petrimonas sp.]
MNSIKNVSTSLLFVILFFSGCEKSGIETVEKDLPAPLKIELRSEEAQLVKTDQQFAFEFFSNVFEEEAKEEDQSFMVSPFSLSMALAMTWNGAAGETKTTMQKTLKMESYSDNDINGYYKKLKEALLKTDPSTQLSIANAIFTNKFVTIQPGFIKTNTDYYDATVQPVDFSLP